jgi:hypothetical protein
MMDRSFWEVYIRLTKKGKKEEEKELLNLDKRFSLLPFTKELHKDLSSLVLCSHYPSHLNSILFVLRCCLSPTHKITYCHDN